MKELFREDMWQYRILEDGTVAITSAILTKGQTDVVIPSVLGGRTVATLADRAFYAESLLTGIRLPDSVTTIGEQCFSRSSLQCIHLPGSIGQIPYECFMSCDALIEVDAPGVRSVSKEAFSGCSSLVNASFPGVEIVGDYAFHGCVRLPRIDLPRCLYLGSHVFEKSGALNTVRLSGELKEIPSWTFYGCHSLESVEMASGLLSIGDWAFCDCCDSLRVFRSDSVRSIGECSFRGSSSLETVCLASIARIGSRAFAESHALSDIHLGSHLEEIGGEAFPHDNEELAIHGGGECAWEYCHRHGMSWEA